MVTPVAPPRDLIVRHVCGHYLGRSGLLRKFILLGLLCKETVELDRYGIQMPDFHWSASIFRKQKTSAGSCSFVHFVGGPEVSNEHALAHSEDNQRQHCQ